MGLGSRCHSPRGPLCRGVFLQPLWPQAPALTHLRPGPALSPEGPAVVVVSLQGALVTHPLPSGVTPAEATESL